MTSPPPIEMKRKPCGQRVTIRVAVGHRLGALLRRPHTCCHCGSEVDALATHGLSCHQSQHCHFHHAALSSVIHRSLTSAKIPSHLEPPGLQRSDEVTVVPWRCGKLLVWDATSPDILAPSYSLSATSEAGAVAAGEETRKRTKYTCLEPIYTFTPVAIETSGDFGSQTLEFLGNQLSRVTGEVNSFTYLLQMVVCGGSEREFSFFFGNCHFTINCCSILFSFSFVFEFQYFFVFHFCRFVLYANCKFLLLFVCLNSFICIA